MIVDNEIENTSDCVQYLFDSLDDLGKQTYLSSLVWASKISGEYKIPTRVEELLKRELKSIV